MKQKLIARILLCIAIVFFMFTITSYAAEDEDVTNYFQDENLKQAILEKVRDVTGNSTKETILQSDIEAITADDLPSGKQLNLAGKNITNLAGLELFADKGIEWIYLDWNQITDMSVLEKFTSLTKISASGNQITNIGFLQNLHNLENINFSNNAITDITSIGNLSNLKYIYLDNNQITDITAISNLQNLREISVSGNQITNCDIVTNLENLENIDASRNQIATITGFTENTSITKLNLNYNQLNNLSGLEKCRNIEVLSVSNNSLVDISSITDLTKLYNLNLNKNEIVDITPLYNNTILKYAYLDNNHIIDATALETLENIEKVTIYNQSTYTIITEEYATAEKIQLNLTSLFQNLKKEGSKIYVQNIEYEMDNNITYEVANDMSYIVFNVADVQKEDLIFRMKDDSHTYITLTITYQEQEKPSPVPPIQDNEIENTNTVPEEPIDPDNNENNNQSPQTPEEPSSDVYVIQDGYIQRVNCETTVEAFMRNIALEKSSYIVRGQNVLKNTDIVATGDVLKTDVGNYVIIIQADTSGDGKVNIMDLMQVKRHVLGSKLLTGDTFLAADLNTDKKINIMDIMRIIKIIIK